MIRGMIYFSLRCQCPPQYTGCISRFELGFCEAIGSPILGDRSDKQMCSYTKIGTQLKKLQEYLYAPAHESTVLKTKDQAPLKVELHQA